MAVERWVMVMTQEELFPDEEYYLKISRRTIDKLGVKLYDKASAVVAELIANGYDGDAETVVVSLPLGSELGHKEDDGTISDRGFEITVYDDGHGMTPAEARDFYLDVGRDRRMHPEQGPRSRHRQRPVMGRKGIGKLAPFGICRKIEVLSSGGEKTEQGYLTSHFFLEYDKVVDDELEATPLEKGDRDGTWSPQTETLIRLTDFLNKRVPDTDTFLRQVARRFGLADPEFTIMVTDTRDNVEHVVNKFEVETMEESVVDLAAYPVPFGDQELEVTGWLGLAKDSWSNDEVAGVRIYARGKIVATTRDFEHPAGFTGEHTIRSYLVGEVHAEWLDEDDEEDLIRTDRQAILWDSEKGEALRAWGAERIRKLGEASRGPRRKRTSEIFIEKSNIKQLAAERYVDELVQEKALELAKAIGGFAAEDELESEEYVTSLTEIILSIAPHQVLVDAFRTIAGNEDATVEELINLFGKTRVAELASYAQIANERIQSIARLREAIDKPDVTEPELQEIIATAPWLIRPDWSVITANQGLKTFRERFVKFWKDKTGEDIQIAISYENKRPDFTLVHAGRTLHVVELKAPEHVFNDDDYERLENYLVAFAEFEETHPHLMEAFPDGWQVTLVADDMKVTEQTKKLAFGAFLKEGRVQPTSWDDFLYAARIAHEEFLEAQARAAEEVSA